MDTPVPFRWDLIGPDQLGSMIDPDTQPDLWFLPELVQCTGKVLARSGGGDLVFVGRSLDSMFDLLGGALAGCDAPPGLDRLPLSFALGRVFVDGTWQRQLFTDAHRRQLRAILTGLGLTPPALARRDRPVTFVDVVHEGGTFTDLFTQLREWIEDERAQWDVIRRKLRFVGVTRRQKTSPNTWRWQQHEDWTGQLPSGSVVNVSLDPALWSHFGDVQTKLTRTLRPDRWLAEADGPGRAEATRQALSEAVALVAFGRSAAGRRQLARAIDGEPALAQAWLRSLVRQLAT